MTLAKQEPHLDASISAKSIRYQELLGSVDCNLCGASDYDVIYPPRYHAAQPDRVWENFRSSGDEVLLDQLVRCRCCGLQYLNPRLRQDLILHSYSKGTDEIFLSQQVARECTFAKCLDKIEKIVPPGF